MRRNGRFPWQVGIGLAVWIQSGGCAPEGRDEPVIGIEEGEWLPGGDTTNRLLLGRQAFVTPAENITPEHETAFFAGNSFFNQAWVQAPASTEARDGLGPLFNAQSCAGCHFKDGRGRPPEGEEDHLGLLFRLSIGGDKGKGAPQPDPVYGGQLQPFAIPGVPAEAHVRIDLTRIRGTYGDGEPWELMAPEYVLEDLGYGAASSGLRVSPRVAPSVIGLGLLEAIPAARLDELADPDDADGNGISGRVQRVFNDSGRDEVGRFGWKAEQPTVHHQSAAAFLGDMGLTTSLEPGPTCTSVQQDCLDAADGGAPEVDDRTLERIAIYASLLAVPIRRDWDHEDVLRGKALFLAVGCGDCHTPSHMTGDHPELSEVCDQLIWPYTDLLLHDMGEDLADDRPTYEADGREWRTPPLWGLGLIPTVNGHDRLLHDGRARGIAEAILWHAGEAEAARESFAALSEDERGHLVRFVESL